jgi:predicted acyltransferase
MNKRIESVDIFRGLTIALMILVNTPGTWSAVYPPFLHADWHGYTPTDLVFPFFLFIVGTSIVFAYRDRKGDGTTHRKILIRSLKLIGLGLFLGAFIVKFPFFKPFENIRFPGVLQRIGVVFFFASLLYLHLRPRVLIGTAITILLGYWIWMAYIPLGGEPPSLDRAPNNWANFLDVTVFGTHNYKPDYDPEGLLSTLPAIVTSILGIITGRLLLSDRQDKLKAIFMLGFALLVAGTLWDFIFPINKALWTSSFVLVTAGWANLVLGIIYYFTDVKGITFGSIFKYAGANAITVYFLSSFISKIFYMVKIDGDVGIHGWLFNGIYVHDFMPLELSSLLYGLSVMTFYLFLGWFMYRRKIFIKV